MSNVQSTLLEVMAQTMAVEEQEMPTQQEQEKAILQQALIKAVQDACSRVGEQLLTGSGNSSSDYGDTQLYMLQSLFKTLNKLTSTLPDNDPVRSFIESTNNFLNNNPDLTKAENDLSGDISKLDKDESNRDDTSAGGIVSSIFTLGVSNGASAIMVQEDRSRISSDKSEIAQLGQVVGKQFSNSSQTQNDRSAKVGSDAEMKTHQFNSFNDLVRELSETLNKNGQE